MEGFRETYLSILVSEIFFSGTQALILYKGEKYGTFITKYEKRILWALNGNQSIPIIINTSHTFRFGINISDLLNEVSSPNAVTENMDKMPVESKYKNNGDKQGVINNNSQEVIKKKHAIESQFSIPEMSMKTKRKRIEKKRGKNNNIKKEHIQLSITVSEISFSGEQAVILHDGKKYRTFVTKSEKEILLLLNKDQTMLIMINTLTKTFKFRDNFSELPKKKVQNIPNAQIPQKEQRITLEIENIEFLDNHYLIWIVREGKKDISIAPLKVADNNSHPCLKLIHKYFSERFPKSIDVIYNSERVIGLSQPYILSSYIKTLNRNIDEHGEWWEEVQNARKKPLTVCRNIPAAQVYKDMSLRNSHIDYLAGMPNQKTVIKIYEVRQNQQEDVFIFTVSIGNGLYAVIYENVSFTATATWVFIVREENYEECINRIFDYFTNYELHYKRQSLVKSLNPPQKFKAETYQKIMHDEPKGWIKRLNDILNREIPSNEIQFNQGLHIAAEANTRSVSSEMGKVQHLHNELMRKLYYQLCQEYGEENVGTENRIGTKKIDVVVKIDGGYNIYEIKTDAEPRGCVREAMGQILDYAFYECENVIYKMVIVGATPETKEVNTYLAKFREKNALEIYYMSV